VVEDGVEVYERLTRKLAIESLTSNNLIFSWASRSLGSLWHSRAP